MQGNRIQSCGQQFLPGVMHHKIARGFSIEASDDGGCRDTVARCLAALHEARVLLERQIAEAAP